MRVTHLGGDDEGCIVFQFLIKTFIEEGGISIVAQGFKNPTSIHEDAGLIPSLAQWVKEESGDAVSCGVGLRCSSNLPPSLGTSIYYGCGPKKTKTILKKRKKEYN